MIRIADDMRTWRAVFCVSQQELADLVCVNVRTIGRWERDEARPAEDHYETLRYLLAQPPPGWKRNGRGARR